MRGIANLLATGPFSVTIPDTAGLIGIPNSASGSSLSDDLLPWLIGVDVFQTAVSQTNWSTVVVDSGGTDASVYHAFSSSTVDQNAQINFDVVLAAGTWTFELMHMKANYCGIYTVSLDGSSIGTIDGYAVAVTPNTRSQIAGVAIALTGKIRLKLQMATKNASSSAYTGQIHHIQFKRTV